MISVLAQDETSCGFVCEWVLQRTDNEVLSNFVGTIVPDVLRVIVIFAVAWLINRVLRRLIKRIVRRMIDEEEGPFTALRKAGPLGSSQPVNPQRAVMRTETVGAVLRSVSTLVVWVVAILVAVGSLDSLDINLGPLIASAGIVGVALGFGAQSLVKDFLTGTFMLLEDQYGIGDIVNLGPATGVVEQISLRKTQIRDLEGTVWHIPNSEITRVGNLSQLWSRTLLDVDVAYDTDLRHAITVIKGVADDLYADLEWSQTILEEPEVWGVESFGESAITIRMVVKTQPAKQWEVNRQLRLRLKEAFDREGIEIPLPQRDVSFRAEDEPHSAAAQERDVTSVAPPLAAASQTDAGTREPTDGTDGEQEAQ